MQRLALFLGLGLAATALYAADAEPVKPGEYITEGGWGTLVVKKKAAAGLSFSIEALGANGHQCSLEGVVQGGRAKLDVGKGEPQCVVGFAPKGSDVVVDVQTAEPCRFFCGMRASFDATYLLPAPGCSGPEKTSARKQFKRLYSGKDYRGAQTALEPVLRNCGKTLHWTEEGSIRNDLAVTQYHLGDLAACLETLKPYAKDALLPDDQVAGSLPPADAEANAGIIKAARTNLKLCGGKGR